MFVCECVCMTIMYMCLHKNTICVCIYDSNVLLFA